MLIRIASCLAAAAIAMASNAGAVGSANRSDTGCPAPTSTSARGSAVSPKPSGTIPAAAITISGSNLRSTGQGPVALGPKPDDPSGKTALGPKPDDPSGTVATGRQGPVALGPKPDDPSGLSVNCKKAGS